MNTKMMDVPIRVYKEARRKDDYGTMERAMGYAEDFAGKAEEYKTLADKGMKEEAEEARKKAEEEQRETIEKRREENEKIQERIEAGKETQNEPKTGMEKTPETTSPAVTDSLVRVDTIEISEDGKKLWEASQKGQESAEQ